MHLVRADKKHPSMHDSVSGTYGNVLLSYVSTGKLGKIDEGVLAALQAASSRFVTCSADRDILIAWMSPSCFRNSAANVSTIVLIHSPASAVSGDLELSTRSN